MTVPQESPLKTGQPFLLFKPSSPQLRKEQTAPCTSSVLAWPGLSNAVAAKRNLSKAEHLTAHPPYHNFWILPGLLETLDLQMSWKLSRTILFQRENLHPNSCSCSRQSLSSLCWLMLTCTLRNLSRHLTVFLVDTNKYFSLFSEDSRVAQKSWMVSQNSFSVTNPDIPRPDFQDHLSLAVWEIPVVYSNRKVIIQTRRRTSLKDSYSSICIHSPHGEEEESGRKHPDTHLTWEPSCVPTCSGSLSFFFFSPLEVRLGSRDSSLTCWLWSTAEWPKALSSQSSRGVGQCSLGSM